MSARAAASARTAASPRTAASQRLVLPNRKHSIIPAGVRSLYFDGSGDGVAMGNNFSFERTDPFSFSCWANFRGAAGQYALFGKTTTASAARGYYSAINAKQWTLYLRNTAVTNELIVKLTFGSPFTSGMYRHMVVTYDGSSTPGGVVFYVDRIGGSQTTTTNNLTGTIINTGSFCVGAVDSLVIPWIGGIAKPRIHNACLTAAQVANLYYDDVAASVAGSWPLNEGSGATATADVGGINGTITGATWSRDVPSFLGLS